MDNDDIQDFDPRWEQALLLTSDPSSDKVLEGLYVSKLQDSSQAQRIRSLYNQEILRGGGKRDYQRLRTCVKLHVERFTERVAVTKVKGQISVTKRKTGECFQWKANGSCSKGDSCSFLHSHASKTERHQRKERRTLEYPASKQPLITSEGEKVKGKHPLLYRREIDRLSLKARQVWRPTLRELKFIVFREQDVKDRRVIVGIIPCVVVTSLETGTFMAIIDCIDMLMVRSKPSKRSKKEGTRGAVAILRGKRVQGCASQKLRSNEFYFTESWRIGIERFGGTRHEILWMQLVRNKIRERKM